MPELGRPQRKNLRLSCFDYSGNCAYFITICVQNRLHLFGEMAGTVKADLPQMIQWFKTQTTNAYIRGVRNGWYLPFDRHLWQRGYYEHVIRNEQDLADTRAYIQNNPVQWALRRADT